MQQQQRKISGSNKQQQPQQQQQPSTARRPSLLPDQVNRSREPGLGDEVATQDVMRRGSGEGAGNGSPKVRRRSSFLEFTMVGKDTQLEEAEKKAKIKEKASWPAST